MGVTDDQITYLEDKATQIREDVIKMLLEAGSGHSAPFRFVSLFGSEFLR